MKNMGETSYIIDIKIHKDRKERILKLSQKAYIKKVLQRFNMNDREAYVASIIKSNRFCKGQLLENALEQEQIKSVLYESTVGSLMYAQVYTHPYICLAIKLLGPYQSNPGLQYQIAMKTVIQYLQLIKDYMLNYMHTKNLQTVSYSYSDYVNYVDTRKQIYISSC